MKRGSFELWVLHSSRPVLEFHMDLLGATWNLMDTVSNVHFLVTFGSKSQRTLTSK